MPSVRQNQFDLHYLPIADEIARLDVEQETRELIATAVADGIARVHESGDPIIGQRSSSGWSRQAFWLLAADPLCPCAGYGEHPCPHGRVIRVGMHLSSASDGRAKSWRSERPEVRCVSCGSRHFRGEPAELGGVSGG